MRAQNAMAMGSCACICHHNHRALAWGMTTNTQRGRGSQRHSLNCSSNEIDKTMGFRFRESICTSCSFSNRMLVWLALSLSEHAHVKTFNPRRLLAEACDFLLIPKHLIGHLLGPPPCRKLAQQSPMSSCGVPSLSERPNLFNLEGMDGCLVHHNAATHNAAMHNASFSQRYPDPFFYSVIAVMPFRVF